MRKIISYLYLIMLIALPIGAFASGIDSFRDFWELLSLLGAFIVWVLLMSAIGNVVINWKKIKENLIKNSYMKYLKYLFYAFCAFIVIKSMIVKVESFDEYTLASTYSGEDGYSCYVIEPDRTLYIFHCKGEHAISAEKYTMRSVGVRNIMGPLYCDVKRAFWLPWNWRLINADKVMNVDFYKTQNGEKELAYEGNYISVKDSILNIGGVDAKIFPMSKEEIIGMKNMMLSDL